MNQQNCYDEEGAIPSETNTAEAVSHNEETNDDVNTDDRVRYEDGTDAGISQKNQRIIVLCSIMAMLAVGIITPLVVINNNNDKNDSSSNGSNTNEKTPPEKNGTNFPSSAPTTIDNDLDLEQYVQQLVQEYHDTVCPAGLVVGISRPTDTNVHDRWFVSQGRQAVDEADAGGGGGGDADADENTNVSPLVNEDTLFEIGSISKPMTGLSLAHTMIRNIGTNDDLSLETPILDLWPPERQNNPSMNWTVIDEINGNVKVATLRHLVSHRSGLPRLAPIVQQGLRFVNIFETNPYAGYSSNELFQSVEDILLSSNDNESGGAQPLNATTFVYSNFGFALLGELLRRQYRNNTESFSQFQQDLIHDPFNMTSTFAGNDTTITMINGENPTIDNPSLLAQGYRKNLVGRLRPTPYWYGGGVMVNGAGSTVSSASDLLMLMEYYLDATKTTTDDEQLMMDPSLQQALISSLEPLWTKQQEQEYGFGIAFGWLYAPRGGYNGTTTNNEDNDSTTASATYTDIFYEHSGATAGFSSMITFQPSTQTAIVGLSNCGVPNNEVTVLVKNISSLVFSKSQ